MNLYKFQSKVEHCPHCHNGWSSGRWLLRLDIATVLCEKFCDRVWTKSVRWLKLKDSVLHIVSQFRTFQKLRIFGTAWHDYLRVGKSLEDASNLIFSMNFDGAQPFGMHTNYTFSPVLLQGANIAPHKRTKPDNIIMIALIGGPIKVHSTQLYFQQIVSDFQRVDNPGFYVIDALTHKKMALLCSSVLFV